MASLVTTFDESIYWLVNRPSMDYPRLLIFPTLSLEGMIVPCWRYTSSREATTEGFSSSEHDFVRRRQKISFPDLADLTQVGELVYISGTDIMIRDVVCLTGALPMLRGCILIASGNVSREYCLGTKERRGCACRLASSGS
jgi:hypothetical protein